MRANAICQKCGARWHLTSREQHVVCNRKIGRRKCGGHVVRDSVRT